MPLVCSVSLNKSKNNNPFQGIQPKPEQCKPSLDLPYMFHESKGKLVAKVACGSFLMFSFEKMELLSCGSMFLLIE